MGCGIGYSTYNWNGLQAACKVVACRYLPPGNIMNERLYITNGEQERRRFAYELLLCRRSGCAVCHQYRYRVLPRTAMDLAWRFWLGWI